MFKTAILVSIIFIVITGSQQKSVRLLTDTLEYSSVFQSVSRNTGRANFKLAVIQLSVWSPGDTTWYLVHDGNNQDKGNVGITWNIPHNLITVYDESTSLGLRSYYVIADNVPMKLVWDAENSTDDVLVFTFLDSSLEESGETKISYIKAEEKWMIKNSNSIRIYGSSGPLSATDPIIWKIEWENWKGPGSSPSGQHKTATSWYLIEVRYKQKLIKLEYDVVRENSSHSFTAAICLKTIETFVLAGKHKNDFLHEWLSATDCTDKCILQNQVNFTLSRDAHDKNDDLDAEFDSTFIKQGPVMLHTVLGYTVVTPSYTQTIRFVYSENNTYRERYLTEILQEIGPNSQSVMKFYYVPVSGLLLLEKVTLPTQVNVIFEYNVVPHANTQKYFDISLPCASCKFDVDFIQGDVILSYLDKDGIVLKYFKEAEIGDAPTVHHLNIAQGRQYEIIPRGNCFAVIIHGSTKKLHFYGKLRDTWSNMGEFNFTKDSTIKFGDDFVIVFENYKPFIIQQNEISNIWEKKSLSTNFTSTLEGSSSTVAVFKNRFLVYDNAMFWIGFRDGHQKWHTKTILQMPGMLDCMRTALHKFDLPYERERKLLNFLENITLQLYENLVLFSRWCVDGAILHTMMDLFVLNSNHIVVKNQTFKITHEDLSKMRVRHNDITYGYKVENSTFNVTVLNIEGQTWDSIVQEYRGVKTIRNLLGISLSNTNIEKLCQHAKMELENTIANNGSRKDLLFNIWEQIGVLKGNRASCGAHHYTFDGMEWNKDIIHKTKKLGKYEEECVALGNKLRLAKVNKTSTIKLYAGANKQVSDKVLVDLELFDYGQIHNWYPIYLAYQNGQLSAPKVIEFISNGQFEKVTSLEHGEQLTLHSTLKTLVSTISKNTKELNTTSYTVRFHQMLGMKQISQNPAITLASICLNENACRSNGYQYTSSKLHNDMIIHEKVSIIPGNDAVAFGWIEEEHYLNNSSSLQRKYYDGATKELIKMESLDYEHSEMLGNIPHPENFLETIYDVSGLLPVATFTTGKFLFEQIAYLGFEDYENNEIGLMKHWLFQSNDIVKGGFSLTGENYLKLSHSRLVGRFQPANQDQIYIASCWVRPHFVNTNLSTLPFSFTANIEIEHERVTHSFVKVSDVKYKWNEWYYMELPVDFPSYTNLKILDTNKTATEMADEKFHVIIMISPINDLIIDVDHVRFSPLQSQFRAKVYNWHTMKITEEIQHDGLINKNIYDDNDQLISSIVNNQRLAWFRTYTKASVNDRISQPNSITQVYPESGYYECFSPFSFTSRWKIDEAYAWKFTPNQLHHVHNNTHKLFLNMSHIDEENFGIRIFVQMDSLQESFLKFDNGIQFKSLSEGVSEFHFSGKKSGMPANAEVVMLMVKKRLFILIEGGLFWDGFSHQSSINPILVRGNITISDVLVFNRPTIQTNYLNALHEKIQEIRIEDENIAIVTEFLYDELGRLAITTEPAKITRLQTEPLLVYYSDFVTNKNPNSYYSVWRTGELQGKLKSYVGPYGFSQVKYCSNPLEREMTVDLPRKSANISTPYSKKFQCTCNNSYIVRTYPVQKNYYHTVEYKSRNMKHIIVKDEIGRKVATYSEMPDSPHMLATFHYDNEGNLIKILPPLYHEKNGTLSDENLKKTKVYVDDNALQKSTGIFMTFQNGNIVTKETPDMGKTEKIYQNELLKFKKSYNRNTGHVENITYIKYDKLHRIYETGAVLLPTLLTQNTLNITLNENNTSVCNLMSYYDNEYEPIWRGKTRAVTTFNGDDVLIEELIYSSDHRIVSKRMLIFSVNDTTSERKSISIINKAFVAEDLVLIEYPVSYQQQPFHVNYRYNKLGQMVEIAGPNCTLVRYTHDAVGQIQREEHLPNSTKNYTTVFTYNSATFLTSIEDDFLIEEIEYNGYGYGGDGYFNGMVTSDRFHAKWLETSHIGDAPFKSHSFSYGSSSQNKSEVCFQLMKKSKYFDSKNRQLKIFYPLLNLDFPIDCTTDNMSRIIQLQMGLEGYPTRYGYVFGYGNHLELTSAKYFVGGEKPSPLQANTFNETILDIDIASSKDIWKLLCEAKYITVNTGNCDSNLAQGKRGKSFIRSTLESDLRKINNSYGRYSRALEGILTFYAATKKDGTGTDESSLYSIINRWVTEESNVSINSETNIIFNMLKKEGYLSNPLAAEFKETLKKYDIHIPDIVGVLREYFAKQLGEAEFDVEFYQADVNGNHKHFESSFYQYTFQYRDNSNQISKIKRQSMFSEDNGTTFGMEYDSRGNVIKAEHKMIEHIEYHPVSDRPTKITLVDGRSLVFHYDMRGERILKRFINKTGGILVEKHYKRDEVGRILVEKVINYTCQNPQTVSYMFIHGPRGLTGFFRNGIYHTIRLDYRGSVQLILKDNEVVEAYDYQPYGEIMRRYTKYQPMDFPYLFLSQELDYETYLYNFHARLYDQTIGRFYQPDPKEQYFNPYKYADNSPVSLVDPNGELPVLIPVFFGLLGSYFGGGSANDQWNPIDWRLDKLNTWTSVLLGGLSGALMQPAVGFSKAAIQGFLGVSARRAMVYTFTFGTAGATLNMAAENDAWNPSKWDFTPATLDAAFQGAALGISMPGFVKGAHTVYNGISSTIGRGAYIGGGAFITTLGITLTGNSTNWDLSNPRLYSGVADAVMSGLNIPSVLTDVLHFWKLHGKTVVDHAKHLKSYKSLILENGEELPIMFSTDIQIPLHKRAQMMLLSLWKSGISENPVAISYTQIMTSVPLTFAVGYITYKESVENAERGAPIYAYYAMLSQMTAYAQFHVTSFSGSKKLLSHEEYIQRAAEPVTWKKLSISVEEYHPQTNSEEGATGVTQSLSDGLNLIESQNCLKPGGTATKKSNMGHSVHMGRAAVRQAPHQAPQVPDKTKEKKLHSRSGNVQIP